MKFGEYMGQPALCIAESNLWDNPHIDKKSLACKNRVGEQALLRPISSPFARPGERISRLQVLPQILRYYDLSVSKQAAWHARAAPNNRIILIFVIPQTAQTSR